jgi:hypothetical protein
MKLDLHQSQTATGKPELVASVDCDWSEFSSVASAVVDRFGMTITEQYDGLDERVWIATHCTHEFCISWDIWMREVTVMCWGVTPDDALKSFIS